VNSINTASKEIQWQQRVPGNSHQGGPEGGNNMEYKEVTETVKDLNKVINGMKKNIMSILFILSKIAELLRVRLLTVVKGGMRWKSAFSVR